jgi:hypothetical protein
MAAQIAAQSPRPGEGWRGGSAPPAPGRRGRLPRRRVVGGRAGSVVGADESGGAVGARCPTCRRVFASDAALLQHRGLGTVPSAGIACPCGAARVFCSVRSLCGRLCRAALFALLCAVCLCGVAARLRGPAPGEAGRLRREGGLSKTPLTRKEKRLRAVKAEERTVQCCPSLACVPTWLVVCPPWVRSTSSLTAWLARRRPSKPWIPGCGWHRRSKVGGSLLM